MSQPRVVSSYLLWLQRLLCNLFCKREDAPYIWELHKVLPENAIVIKCNCINYTHQNLIFSALDCQRSVMETSVLGFMRFDNIGFATSALAWPHQRALQQVGREGQDCTDGTDGRSFQIRKVTRLQSYKMHAFAHCGFPFRLLNISLFLDLFHGFPKAFFNLIRNITYHFYRHRFNG